MLRPPQRRPDLGVAFRRAAAAAAAPGLVGERLDPRRRRRPAVFAAARDRPPAHRIDVVEQVLAVAGGVVDDGAVERNRVVDRLPELPLLRRNREGQIAVRNLALQHQRDAHRRRVADGLGQDRDDVVEVAGVADAAIPPAVIRPARCHRRARLALAGQALVHVRAERLQAENQQRIEVVVVRIALRRRPDYGPGRPALVVVVENLRQPLVIQDAVDVLGLGLGRGEEVAVVVVADVVMVEARQPGGAPLQRIRVAHVPVGDELVAVGVGVHEQQDALVEEAQRFLVAAADHLVDRLHQLLRPEGLVGVKPAVDPDDRLALPGQCPGRLRRQALGERQPPRDVLVLCQVLVVRRRRHDRHQLRPSFRRLADLLDDEAIGLGVELAPVGGNLRVVGQLIVVAEVEAELRPRRGDAALRHRRGSDEGQRQQQRAKQAETHAESIEAISQTRERRDRARERVGESEGRSPSLVEPWTRNRRARPRKRKKPMLSVTNVSITLEPCAGSRPSR